MEPDYENMDEYDQYDYSDEYSDHAYEEAIADSQPDGGFLDGFGVAPGIGLGVGYAWSQTTVYDADGNEIHRESSRGPFGGLGLGIFGSWF